MRIAHSLEIRKSNTASYQVINQMWFQLALVYDKLGLVAKATSGGTPTYLGDMPLNVAGTDSETPICTGDLMYRNYVVETIT